MSVLMIPRKQNRAADVAKGIAGLAGTVALVVGVPVALLTWVGSPLPAGMPSASDVTGALRDTYIPDEFLVKALALVCWLVWIELVASVLVEAVAYARGRKAGSVPLAGGLQRGAARLVATVALLGVLVAGRGGSAERAAQPLPAVAPQPVSMSLVVDQEATNGIDREGGAVTDADMAAAAPTYEVQHRDTLWDIAERHLGDPFRWQEIFRLNEGCPQADGRCLTDPDVIFAGWRLDLPADAVGVAEATAEPAPSAPSEAPDASPPGRSSVVLDGGMVLINEGADSIGGDVGGGAVGDDVLVGSGVTPAAGTSAGGGVGMVLLPDDAVSGTTGPGGAVGAPDVGDVGGGVGGGVGMVLLPGDALAAPTGSDSSPLLAGPAPEGSPHDSGGPGDAGTDGGDELASGPVAPRRPETTDAAGRPPR